jgi:hypothetical protein
MGVGGQRHATPSLYSRERTGRLGRPQGRFGWVWRRENIFPLPGFEPQTIEPVTCHYTGYAIPIQSLDLYVKE